MNPTQPRECVHCGRRIGAGATHYLAPTTDPVTVVCVRCLARPNHARAYPDCPHRWHDMHDHELISATRAGIARRNQRGRRE